jgi:septum formation protein
MIHPTVDSIKSYQDVNFSFILGSDTIVDKDGMILEKPKSEEDARRMLSLLSGSWHEVHTGVAIYKVNHRTDEVLLVSSFTETAQVKFTMLSDEDIDAYVQTGEPMDKAGGYGIQGIGGQIVERLEGDFFAVMGLPMHRLSGELAKALEDYVEDGEMATTSRID